MRITNIVTGNGPRSTRDIATRPLMHPKSKDNSGHQQQGGYDKGRACDHGQQRQRQRQGQGPTAGPTTNGNKAATIRDARATKGSNNNDKVNANAKVQRPVRLPTATEHIPHRTNRAYTVHNREREKHGQLHYSTESAIIASSPYNSSVINWVHGICLRNSAMENILLFRQES